MDDGWKSEGGGEGNGGWLRRGGGGRGGGWGFQPRQKATAKVSLFVVILGVCNGMKG